MSGAEFKARIILLILQIAGATFLIYASTKVMFPLATIILLIGLTIGIIWGLKRKQ